VNDKWFRVSMLLVALGFSLIFCIVVVPELIVNPGITAALSAGFVNPYAAGFATDAIFCWIALAVLVIYDAKVLSVRHGWVCLLLGIVPGVAVGLAVYFILRSTQVHQVGKNT
jgi:Protein of unknown function DUF2834